MSIFLPSYHLRSVPAAASFAPGLVSLWFSRLGATPAGFFVPALLTPVNLSVHALSFRRFVGLLVLALLCMGLSPLRAQFALSEGGVRVALGVIAPLEAPRAQVGPSISLGGFYTHYLCGKRSGYWLEGALVQHFFNERGGTAPSLVSAAATGPNQYTLLNLQLAALYKFRPVNYHRAREWAFLIGPKLDLALTPRVATGSEGFGLLADSATRQVRTGWLGLHTSVIYRRPMMRTSGAGRRNTTNHSLLFQLSVDWYPTAWPSAAAPTAAPPCARWSSPPA